MTGSAASNEQEQRPDNQLCLPRSISYAASNLSLDFHIFVYLQPIVRIELIIFLQTIQAYPIIFQAAVDAGGEGANKYLSQMKWPRK